MGPHFWSHARDHFMTGGGRMSGGHGVGSPIAFPFGSGQSGQCRSTQAFNHECSLFCPPIQAWGKRSMRRQGSLVDDPYSSMAVANAKSSPDTHDLDTTQSCGSRTTASPSGGWFDQGTHVHANPRGAPRSAAHPLLHTVLP